VRFPGFERSGSGGLFAPYPAAVVLALRLRRERFDAALILRADHWWGALVCAVAGIPIRVGVATEPGSWFLTATVPARGGERIGATSERVVRGGLAALHLPAADGVFRGDFTPTPEAHQRMSAWLRANTPRGRTVVVHPGAGGPAKLWSSARWAEVARFLSETGWSVVLTAGPGERRMIRQVQKLARRAFPTVLEPSWDDLAALYAEVDLVAGCDSGPLHLATAVGTPTVRLYGPSDPAVYGPAGAGRDRVLSSPLPCAPCGNFVDPPCGYTSSAPCMALITVEEVLAAVQESVPSTAV
jgi:ADP-heptose:LPS heptosyltransferase